MLLVTFLIVNEIEILFKSINIRSEYYQDVLAVSIYVAFILFLLIKRIDIKHLFINKFDLKVIVEALLSILIYIFIINTLNNYYKYNFYKNYIFNISIVLNLFIAPFFEELLFRGILFDKLKKEYNIVIAYLGSSILFSILHLNLISSVIFSFICCYYYNKSRNIVVPIFIHFINNLIFYVCFGH